MGQHKESDKEYCLKQDRKGEAGGRFGGLGRVSEGRNGGSCVCLVWLRSSSPDGFHEQELTPDLHSAGTLLHPLHPLPPSYYSYTQHLIVPHCEILHSPNHLCRKSHFVPLQTQREVCCTVCLHTVGFTTRQPAFNNV